MKRKILGIATLITGLVGIWQLVEYFSHLFGDREILNSHLYIFIGTMTVFFILGIFQPEYDSLKSEKKQRRKRITNADRIRIMTDKELANWVIAHDTISLEKGYLNYEQILQWMKEESLNKEDMLI